MRKSRLEIAENIAQAVKQRMSKAYAKRIVHEALGHMPMSSECIPCALGKQTKATVKRTSPPNALRSTRTFAN